MKIGDNTVPSIDYELTDADGQLVESTKDESPLTYLHGANTIIPGLEAALTGKQAGDEFELSIPPDDAYGEFDAELRQVIPKEQFEEVGEIEVGMQLQVPSDDDDDDEYLIITITEIGEDTVTVDGNHPMAGETLNFKIQVRDVREATPQEIEHGHAHGSDGHDHDH